MALDPKDVLRVEGSETGVFNTIRERQNGYTNDTYRILHKYIGGEVKSWPSLTEIEDLVNLRVSQGLTGINTIYDENVITAIDGYPTLTNQELVNEYLLYVEGDVSIAAETGAVDKGLTVDTVDLEWTLNAGKIESQSLEIISGQGGSLNSSTRAYTYTGLGLTTDTAIDYYFWDGRDTGAETAYVRFKLNKYYGTSTNDYSAITESNIEAGTAVLSTDTASSRVLSAVTITGGGDYCYYAYPAAWGSVSLTVNGFATTWNEATVSVSNGAGNTENYKVYVSPYQITGTITLVATAA